MAQVELVKAAMALSSVGKSPFRREASGGGSHQDSVAGEETDSLITQVKNSVLFSIAMTALVSASEYRVHSSLSYSALNSRSLFCSSKDIFFTESKLTAFSQTFLAPNLSTTNQSCFSRHSLEYLCRHCQHFSYGNSSIKHLPEAETEESWWNASSAESTPKGESTAGVNCDKV